MNKRQTKKLYKKIHGHNPAEGRIPAALLKNPGKEKTLTFLDKQIGMSLFDPLEPIETETRLPKSVLETIWRMNEPIENVLTQEERERITVATRCFRKTMNDSIRRMNSRFGAMREKLKGSGDPVVITTRRLSENRKKNKRNAWRRVRRNR